MTLWGCTQSTISAALTVLLQTISACYTCSISYLLLSLEQETSLWRTDRNNLQLNYQCADNQLPLAEPRQYCCQPWPQWDLGVHFQELKYSLKAGLFCELLLKGLISPFHPFPSPATERCTAAPFPLLFVLPCYEILYVGQPCVAPLVCKDEGEHKGACPSSGIDCAGKVLMPPVPGRAADALVTEVSKGKGKVFSSRCPLSRYFVWLSHEELPFCPRLYLKNTSRLLLRWAPRWCWL